MLHKRVVKIKGVNTDQNSVWHTVTSEQNFPAIIIIMIIITVTELFRISLLSLHNRSLSKYCYPHFIRKPNLGISLLTLKGCIFVSVFLDNIKTFKLV